ncbi:serine/threonine-protein kinase drkB [Phytophthora cinnamomi]|uniref:serine/threonine-protein kinase drkB n=1 Tax=Phytophthora cinnamomi TaxID=4785 RepID=UPI003559E7EF|nr:serine/threonine-protein kinase drkB [Phytophthora cinnamomi]
MPLAQTQSLPAWAPMKPCKPAVDDEDPLYLSGEETDCDSERGSDTLSREDQQLMASFIRLQRERAHKQLFHKEVSRPAVAAPRTSPVLIPAQTRKYVATSTKRWLWDEDEEEEDDADQCPCCAHPQKQQQQSESWQATSHAAAATDAAASDLIFDLEL